MFKYIKLADQLKEIIQKKKQLKQVIYKDSQNKNQSFLSISASYSLLCLVTNNYSKFQEFIEKIQIKSKSTIQNPFLLIIMTGEYINTGKIQGGGKIKRIILENINLLPEIRKQSKINKENVQIRLIENTLNKEQYQKWKNIFEEQNKIKSSSIIPNVYNFTANDYQKIIQEYTDLLSSPNVVIQSFSSSLPPFLLLHGVDKSNLKNFKIIDACSAPGNKTIQLAEYVYNQNFKNRNVLAFQKDPKRFEVLNKTVTRFNSQKNIKTFNENFLQTNPDDEKFQNLKFVLLDPSCSGSGMLSNYLRDLSQDQKQLQKMKFQDFCQYQYQNLNEKQRQRVENLHNFQTLLLNHSAKFKPKRISYSTCSIYQRQNQDVVHLFLNENPKYALKENVVIKKNIGTNSICQGFGQYKNCVRLDPRKRQTDGFFVAIFYRKKQ